MFRKLAAIAFVATMGLAVAGNAQAATRYSQLTPSEVRTLKVEKARIASYRKLALRDGRISPVEKKKLAKMNLAYNRLEYRLSHNRLRR